MRRGPGRALPAVCRSAPLARSFSRREPPEVAARLYAAGYYDEQRGAPLSTVTAATPLFLTEVLRHVEESGGRWDPTPLPQGVREAVGRRVSRLSPSANDALLVGAVAGSRF